MIIITELKNMEGNEFNFIILILIAVLIAMITGCCSYKEYYESGQLKKEYYGIEFSDKTININ